MTVLSDDVQWLQDVELTKTYQVLHGPGNIQLPVKGLFYATLKYRQSKLTADKDVEEVNTGPTDFKAESPALFNGLGKLKTECHKTLRPDAIPFCLYNPRKIPHPLIPKVKSQIETMLQQGVISPVTAPTEWCGGIVPVLKPNGSVRICVDLTHLNKTVQREIHPTHSEDENLAKLGDSKIFSKVDANSGFWQIPLDDESKLLTTFFTPFGRFCFNRLPFGISSAPKIFQRSMSKILEGSKGTLCQMDDVLIHGVDQSEYDGRVRAVLHRLQEAGLTLNDKCEFSRSSNRLLAHIIDSSGLHVDPQKTTAVTQFPVPSDVAGIQRFMGMVNHLGKFIPHLADFSDPLRQLLRKDSVWVWGEPQQKAFEQIKQAVQCVTRQDLSATQKRYAIIEKEALVTTWASERFSDYMLAFPFTLETDHKLLTVLLNSSGLSKMPTPPPPHTPYPSFPPETYEIQLSSSICTRKTSSHRRYTRDFKIRDATAVRRDRK